MNATSLPRTELVTQKQRLDHEIHQLKLRLLHHLPQPEYLRLERQRLDLVGQKMRIDEQLQEIKLAAQQQINASTSKDLPLDDRICLMVLEMDDKRFYHAARGDFNTWLVDLIEHLAEDAPIVISKCFISEELAQRLPSHVWTLRE